MTINGVGNVQTLYDMLGQETAARKKLVASDFGYTWTRGDL